MSRARIAAYDARSNESLTLIARGSGGAYEEAYQESAGTVDEQLRKVSGIDASLQGKWQDYKEVHVGVRKLDTDGKWDQAVDLAVGKTPKANSVLAFGEFDRTSAAQLGTTSRTQQFAGRCPRRAAADRLAGPADRDRGRAAGRLGHVAATGGVPMKKLLAPVAASLAILLAATACGSGAYDATEIPPRSSPPRRHPHRRPPSDGLRNPGGVVHPRARCPPLAMPAGTYMAKIQQRGRLIAGVSADSLNLGSRDPISGQIVGFDIDMIRAVAKAIFGDPNKVELRVISSPQRIPTLQKEQVDIVARNMTINCSRWKDIAFSAEYYRSGQKTLVPIDSTAKSTADLNGKTICAPAGSTSLDNLKKENPQVVPITADTDTGCLALFQSGKAYGISGDDTVLAGDVAQDPYAKVLPQRFSDEPYGLGMSLKHPEFVRFVNQVLDQIKADGTWMGSYNKWLMPALGELKSPPPSVYGRAPGQ